MWKEKIKKLFPKVYFFYRKTLANLAGFFYRWPSEKLKVIGVTGTGGKSTVVNLVAKIFKDSGLKVGVISSYNFRINTKEWPNTSRMTMPGPFYLQKLLHRMVKEKCQYAVIETTSQGLIQWRHIGINYDLAVITNLLPEHLESHGSFEQYKQAKGLLFESLNKKRKIIEGEKIKKIKIINLDDKEADYFLNFKSNLTYGYGLGPEKHYLKFCSSFGAMEQMFRDLPTSPRVYAAKAARTGRQINQLSEGQNLNINKKCQKIIYPIPGWGIKENGLKFIIERTEFKTNLLSKFNLYNSLAAITTCFACGINLEKMKESLAEVEKIPGRFEIIIDEPFKVVIDYAHTPDELFGVYSFFSAFGGSAVLAGQAGGKKKRRLIVVLGSAGGGRDKWKRKVLGEIADKFADEIILTNEDPYDEEPEEIIEQIAQGIKNIPSRSARVYKIFERREAIRKALKLAAAHDIVLITGKGAEKSIMSKKGKKIPWSDKKVVEEELKGLPC